MSFSHAAWAAKQANEEQRAMEEMRRRRVLSDGMVKEEGDKEKIKRNRRGEESEERR